MTHEQARALTLFMYPLIRTKCVPMVTQLLIDRGLKWTMHEIELDPGLLVIPTNPLLVHDFEPVTANAPEWAQQTREAKSGVV